ncbi:uncharacterized protein LOC129791364 [Lutzomyia longipalpis]|uniref:uncharacterized protein LOC129791364 n=1 Tax=Lutzomyia longipalpis TaxID=7200 RepID=UPI002483FCC2|nr:uncharacterized protein LOC129791364 [Lutzomyia longipalpis]
MDLLKKIMGLNSGQEDKNEKGKKKVPRDDFRKPIWFEESETDDELFDNGKFFDHRIFTANPMELEKHFEKHLQDLLKSYDDFHAAGGEQIKEDFGEKFPSFWGSFAPKEMDKDLDSEIRNSGKLTTILDNLPPNNTPQKSLPEKQQQQHLTDEEKIMAKIHGTEVKEEETKKFGSNPRYAPPKMTPMHPNFKSSVPITGGNKFFGHSIITETVRKPDGSIESRRVVRDVDGNVKTTISRTVGGETKTVTTFNNRTEGDQKKTPEGKDDDGKCATDRNLFVSPNGYTLPKNLW